MDEADNASGWAAIDDALRQLYGDTRAVALGGLVGSLLQGLPDALDGTARTRIWTRCRTGITSPMACRS